MTVSTPPADTTCGERVGGSVTYPCSLERGHKGPHYAIEVPASVSRRRRWEDEQRHVTSALAQFQGFPQTTAERYTDNPTEVPQSEAVARADAQEARWRQAQENLSQMADQAEQGFRSDVAAPAKAEDGLDVLYRDDKIVLKALPDGRYMVENPQGTLGMPVLPTWIDVADDEEPTKQREGDQALPVPNEFADSYEALMADLRERRRVGISRHGVALQPFNGRNTVLDAYEESLDLAVYLRTLLTMREADARTMEDIVRGVLQPLFESANFRGLLAEQTAREYAQRIVAALIDGLFEARTV